MSIEDRRRWEQRHRDAAALTPRPSLGRLPPVEFGQPVALDLACGQGRHARAIVAAGYRVVACDISMRGLLHASAACSDAERESILFVQGDIDEWCLREGAFDLVVQVDFLDRRLFPLLAGCLRAGGLLLVDTFLDQGSPNAEGPSSPSFLLASGELLHAFRHLDILRYEETRGPTARGSLLARKTGGAAPPRP